jgi:ligand-binding sensor domain-containing protein
MRKTYFFVLCCFVFIFSCKKDNEKNDSYDLSNNTEFLEINSANLNSLPINSILINNSDLKWVATDSGLFIYNNISWYKYLFFDGMKINSLSAHNDEMLIATSNGAYTILVDNSSISLLESLNKTDIGSTSDSITVYGFGFFDKKWIGAPNGLANLDGSTWKWNKKIWNNLGGVSDVNSMAFRYNDCFFGTYGKFLYHIYYTNDVTVDAISGASQLLGGSYNPENNFNGELTTDTIFCVYAGSDTSVWFGSTTGLTRNKGGTNSKNGHGVFEYFLRGQRVHCVIEASDNKIWAGTENGLSVFDGNTWTDKSDKLTNKFVSAIAFDKDGSTWIGSKKGLVNIK